MRTSFSFPASVAQTYKTRWVSELCHSVPERKDLAFQQQGRRDAVKTIHGSSIADTPEIEHLFCMVHHDYTLTTGNDIEHAFPFSKIRERQIAFIQLLNTDAELADYFLREEEMSDFFRRDEQDPKSPIKGTHYFFHLCYNDQKNLWLLCHACNLSKSSADGLDWFLGHNSFGQPFLDEIQAAGGLQTGLILDCIYVPQHDDISITLSGRQILLHVGEQRGLGEFTRTWFLKTHLSSYEIYKKFFTENTQTVKKEIETLYRFIQNGEHDNFMRAATRIKRAVTASTTAFKAIASQTDASQSSQSEHTSDEDERAAGVQNGVTKSNQAVSNFKHIRGLLKAQGCYTSGQVDELCSVLDRKKIDADGCKAIYAALGQELQKLPQPTAEDLKVRLAELNSQYCTLNSVETSQVRQTMEQALVQARAERERAIQAAAKEQTAREQAEQEAVGRQAEQERAIRAEARAQALQEHLVQMAAQMRALESQAQRQVTVAASSVGMFPPPKASEEEKSPEAKRRLSQRNE